MEQLIYGEKFLLDKEKNKEIKTFDWFIDVFSAEKWEPITFEVFNKLSDKTKTAIDIGGWIGITSIYLSKKFKNVITIEPDVVSYNTLLSNINDNQCDNVKVHNKAFFNSETKKIFFGVNDYGFDSNLGSSTSQTKINKILDSDYSIDTINIFDVINDVNPYDIGLIKVDIEGGDEDVFRELITVGSKYGWKIWLSFHYGWWKDKNIRRFEDLIPLIKKVSRDTTEISKDDLLSLVELNVPESFLIEL